MEKAGAEQSFSPFNPGDVVYCVGGTLDELPVVEKATVDSRLRNSEPDNVPYHYLIVWNSVSNDPAGEGLTITKMPAELFTEKEVEQMLYDETEEMIDIDSLVGHPIDNYKLVGPLGGAAIKRAIKTPQDLFNIYERTIAWQ